MNLKRVAISGTVLLTVAAILVVVSWDAQPISAAETLTDACTNAAGLESIKMTIETTQIDGDLVTHAMTVTRTNHQGRFHALVTTDRGEYDETIITRAASYKRSAPADPWTRRPEGGADFTLRNFKGDATNLFCNHRSLTDITFMGYQTVDGKSLMHVTAKRDMGDYADFIWPEDAIDDTTRRQFVAGQEDLEFWIDEELGRLIQVRHTASFPQQAGMEPYSFDALIRYANFNALMVIEPPEDFTGVEEEPAPMTFQ